jgi:hypothetical protein
MCSRSWSLPDPETGDMTLNYPGLIAPLTMAVQELAARVSALEAKAP